MFRPKRRVWRHPVGSRGNFVAFTCAWQPSFPAETSCVSPAKLARFLKIKNERCFHSPNTSGGSLSLSVLSRSIWRAIRWLCLHSVGHNLVRSSHPRRAPPSLSALHHRPFEAGAFSSLGCLCLLLAGEGLRLLPGGGRRIGLDLPVWVEFHFLTTYMTAFLLENEDLLCCITFLILIYFSEMWLDRTGYICKGAQDEYCKGLNS